MKHGAIVLLAALLLGGCSKTHKGPSIPVSEKEAIVASSAPVNLLDAKLDSRVAADSGDAEKLADGRLAVAMNLRNRRDKKLHVLVRTVFKDAEGNSIGDETSWNDVFFGPRQIQTYRAESRTVDAQKFTVEVRLPK